MLNLVKEVRKTPFISNSVIFSASFGVFPVCAATENIQECGHARQFSCNIRGSVKFRKLSSRRIGNIFATTGGLQRFSGAIVAEF